MLTGIVKPTPVSNSQQDLTQTNNILSTYRKCTKAVIPLIPLNASQEKGDFQMGTQKEMMSKWIVQRQLIHIWIA
ncbi:hypothetical protein TNCV_685821 [Trichonephila clavipes]|nr:hypothetical protein TNCV_685821 [Trichonephila clavipes]